jgi:S-adenosyl-L-methionine hydrolase (adenosine-forming)
MPKPLITLTTDFGLSDHFVGAMQGIIAQIAPSTRVVDITHIVPPYNVNQAAFIASETWPCFPKGTIHVVVVDPGVGSTRRPLLVEAAGQFFVGPDNGVFTMIYDAVPHRVRELTNARMMRRKVSRTFHGRDVFAPAAAHLAKGAPPAAFGKIIHDYLRLPPQRPEKFAGHAWRGTVLKVDRFGNLITNFAENDFEDLKTRPFELRAGRETIRRLALNYAETEAGELFVIVGSSGYLEIAANQASASEKLSYYAGSPVDLEIFMTAAKR